MYGIAGERSLLEWEVPWLRGLPGGQAGAGRQCGGPSSCSSDVYGEVIGATHQARKGSPDNPKLGWPVQRAMVEHLETVWDQADEGMWEVRGGRKEFRGIEGVLLVRARPLDRGCRDLQAAGPGGALEGFGGAHPCRGLRQGLFGQEEQLQAELRERRARCEPAAAAGDRVPAPRGSAHRRHHRGGRARAGARRVRASLQHRAGAGRLARAGGRVSWPARSGWRMPTRCRGGTTRRARCFDRLLALRNDLGLLAEEYDPVAKRLVGNFPQAFSHTALVGTAARLSANHAAGGGSAGLRRRPGGAAPWSANRQAGSKGQAPWRVQGRALAFYDATRGRKSVKVVPSRSCDATSIRPPSRRTCVRTKASPIPSPGWS